MVCPNVKAGDDRGHCARSEVKRRTEVRGGVDSDDGAVTIAVWVVVIGWIVRKTALRHIRDCEGYAGICVTYFLRDQTTPAGVSCTGSAPRCAIAPGPAYNSTSHGAMG